MREVSPREVKPLAQGHTAFQSERTKSRDHNSHPLAFYAAGSQTRIIALLAYNRNPTMKVLRSEIPPLDILGSLSALIFELGTTIILLELRLSCWWLVLLFAICLMACRNGRMGEWFGQIVLWSVLNEILFTRYTSLLLMCSSLISSHLRAGSLGEKKIN